MPSFLPFPALRYAPDIDLDKVLAPPYDVLSPEDVERLHSSDSHNITWVDVPTDGDYDHAAEILWGWIEDDIMTSDAEDTFSIYRMAFTDAAGVDRVIIGVMGSLQVVDEGAGGVLPHEHTTPKASTDRLELMRATGTNSSPIWGLSLADGLAKALKEPGTVEGSVTFDGVTHTVEKVSDPGRIEQIRQILASDDVLIADGHHRYSVSRMYRDEVRSATGRKDTQAEYTLAFVSELIEDQLSIEAIHRLYAGIPASQLRTSLEQRFELTQAGLLTSQTLSEMVTDGKLVLMWPNGTAEWMTPKPGAFDGLRPLDGLWLESALEGTSYDVTYQHGLREMQERVGSGEYTAGVLIRPTSIEEIRRTAREGLLMPPKSTFFTPKLLTGWVLRPTEYIAGP